MANPDPTIQAAMHEPANFGFIKSLVGLSELVVPGEDARNKQLREINQLLLAAPIVIEQSPGREPDKEPLKDNAQQSGPHLVPTIGVDELLDDHATEFEECRRWSSSDAGQIARVQNPAGFANVRAHAALHAAALARQALAENAGQQAIPPQSPREGELCGVKRSCRQTSSRRRKRQCSRDWPR